MNRSKNDLFQKESSIFTEESKMEEIHSTEEAEEVIENKFKMRRFAGLMLALGDSITVEGLSSNSGLCEQGKDPDSSSSEIVK